MECIVTTELCLASPVCWPRSTREKLAARTLVCLDEPDMATCSSSHSPNVSTRLPGDHVSGVTTGVQLPSGPTLVPRLVYLIATDELHFPADPNGPGNII